MKRRIKVLMVMLALVCGVPAAQAGLVTVSHTWTGSEGLSGSNRLLRNGVASSALNPPKAFPGVAAATSTFFVTFAFSAQPGTTFLVTPTSQDSRSFLALYDELFNPGALASRYLGDQGASSVANVFSVITPSSGSVLLVASTVSNPGTFDIGASFRADVTFTPVVQATVSAPSTLALASLGAAALLGVGLSRGRRRIA